MFNVEEVLERLDGDNGLSSMMRVTSREKASMGACQRLMAISLMTWPAEEH